MRHHADGPFSGKGWDIRDSQVRSATASKSTVARERADVRSRHHSRRSGFLAEHPKPAVHKSRAIASFVSCSPFCCASVLKRPGNFSKFDLYHGHLTGPTEHLSDVCGALRPRFLAAANNLGKYLCKSGRNVQTFGPAPYFCNPPVLAEIYTLDGRLKEELARLPTASTCKPGGKSTHPLGLHTSSYVHGTTRQ